MTLLGSLTTRDRQPELMDDPAVDPVAHRAALRGLARVNRWSRSAGILWPAIAAAAQSVTGRPLRVLDVATGAGDVPVGLWKKARRANLAIEFAGCDLSPTALVHARETAHAVGATINFFPHDALAGPLPTGFDVITSSLFLHHLDEADAVAVLARMKVAAGKLVAVNDLTRSRRAYLLAWGGTRILSRSPIVHTDGPLSVRAAFTLGEVRALATHAGLTGATISPRWPFRFLLTWGPS